MLCCAIHDKLVAKGVMDGMQGSCRIPIWTGRRKHAFNGSCMRTCSCSTHSRQHVMQVSSCCTTLYDVLHS